MHHREVVSGSRPGVKTRLSRSGISSDGRKSVGSCNTKLFTSNHCSLLPHVHMNLTRLEGSITHHIFPSRSHLCVRRWNALCISARDWAVLRSLKGQKGCVNSVSVHPFGKVAHSLGKDWTVCMWDIMRGRRAASMKLGFWRVLDANSVQEMLKVPFVCKASLYS